MRRVITQPVIWLGAALLLMLLPHGLFMDHEVTRRVALALLVSLGLMVKTMEKLGLLPDHGPHASTTRVAAMSPSPSGISAVRTPRLLHKFRGNPDTLAPCLLLMFLALALWRAVHGLAPWYGFYETFWLATLGGLGLLVWGRPLSVRALAGGVAGLGLVAALGARLMGGQWGLTAPVALEGLLQQANATAHLIALGAVAALMLAMEKGRAGNLSIAASFSSKSPHRSLSPLGRGWRGEVGQASSPALARSAKLPGEGPNKKQKTFLVFLHQYQRPLAFALALLLASQLPAQQSKAAWLCLGAGGMGVVAWRLPVVWRGMLLVLGGAAMVGAVVHFGRGEAVQESRSQRERAWMAANAAWLVLDRPLLGHGPGQFPATNLLISPRVTARYPHLQPHAAGVALTPHSEPLAIAHDWGLPGLMLLLWLMILRWPRLKGREPLLLALGALALVDFPFHLAPLALLGVLMVFSETGGAEDARTEGKTAPDPPGEGVANSVGVAATPPSPKTATGVAAVSPPPKTAGFLYSILRGGDTAPTQKQSRGSGSFAKSAGTSFLSTLPPLALALALLVMALGVTVVEHRTFTGERDSDFETLAQAGFMGLTHPYAAKRAGVLLLTPLGENWMADPGARHRAAVRWLSLAARQGRGTASTLNNLGVALKRTGRLPEALVSLKAATALEPAYCLAYDNASGVALLMGEKGEAEQQAIAYRACLTRHRG